VYSLFLLAIVSLALSVVLTPLIRNLAWRKGIVDQPDQRRKMHSAPIPRLGGVAIFAAVIGAYGLLLIARLSSGNIVLADLPLVLRLLPALAIVFGVGLIDDIVSTAPWVRLAVETFAAILAWIGGIRISEIAWHSFSGDVESLIFTVFWIVACTNAINLIDGVDGLAAGVSLFASITMLIAA
jgi:UDP-GlcNAc:undecaprenyl-phosphate GlcNAc-1-phosphate transferase